MTTLDASGFAKLNMWTQADGELCVRPGYRRLVSSGGAGARFVAGWSTRNDFVDEVWHYLVTKDEAGPLHVLVLDENFDTFLDFTWATDGDPPIVTPAIVEGMLLITAPGLPSLFGMVGSGIEYAMTVASVNPTTTALPVPSGICTAFCNRVVIGDGRSLFFSDAIASDGGDVRTFVAENQNQRPGIVYGLHEGAGGMLVAVTSEGVYGLDADAAAVQIVGSNGTAWRLLSHLTAQSHASSCVHRGRVYLLTDEGWSPGDTESMDELLLADPSMPRARGPQIALSDWRRCRLLATDAGPLVASQQVRAFHRSSLQREMSSWWRTQGAGQGEGFQFFAAGDVRGVLRDHHGTELLVMRDGIYAMVGDFDGDVALSGADDLPQPVGTSLGLVPGGAADNRLPRKVNHAAAVDGANEILVAVRGSEHGASVDADAFGITIDETAWGDTSRRYLTTPIANVEIDFGDIQDTLATRDVGIELSARGCATRVNTSPEITYSQSAPRRPQATG